MSVRSKRQLSPFRAAVGQGARRRAEGRRPVATARQRRRRLCDQRPARRGRRLDERLRAVVL